MSVRMTTDDKVIARFKEVILEYAKSDQRVDEKLISLMSQVRAEAIEEVAKIVECKCNCDTADLLVAEIRASASIPIWPFCVTCGQRIK
jgi:hypothetical protein